jgi:hypothetical protein
MKPKIIVRDSEFCSRAVTGMEDVNDKSGPERNCAIVTVLFFGCLLSAMIVAVGFYVVALAKELHNFHPYWFWGVLGCLAGSGIALILHIIIVRLSRKEIKLPKKLSVDSQPIDRFLNS